MKLFTTLAVCLLAFSAFAADAPKNPMKPGKWEVTTQMDMPGMQMPARTFTKCVTKEEAENAENSVPRGRQDAACKLSDVKVEGNTISWKMNCPERQMTGEGKATYEGDTYTGEMHVKSADHEMTIKYTGKRLGDCDAAK
jgi:hypothetical protein